MLRLVRYLKPYLILILMTIVLTFLQANCDLSLPDYLSKIVDVGIQQAGIVNGVPNAIRQSEMDRLLLFMSPEEKAIVLGDYSLVNHNTSAARNYITEYPILAQQTIYILKPIPAAENEKLSTIMGKAWLVVSAVEDPAKAALMTKQAGWDLNTQPPGTDLYDIIAKLPSEQLIQMTTAVQEKTTALDEKKITQMAVGAVKKEYSALGMDTGNIQLEFIRQAGLQMLLVSLLSVFCAIIIGYLAARTAAGVSRDLRSNVFQKVESFSNKEFDTFSTASLITRSTNDITQIQMVIIMMMRMVFYAPVIGIGGIIRALAKSTSMWWIIALAVVILVSMMTIIFSISLPKFKIIQKLIDRLNLVTRENLSGMMVIRSFNMQPFEEKRFDIANRELTSTNLFVNRVMVTMMPVMMMIMNGLSLLIIWVGAHQIAASTMQVGDMMAFLQYAMQIVFAFLMLSFMFIILPRASVSSDRIADVLEMEPSIRDLPMPRKFPEPFVGTVEFRDVCFRYPDALEDVLFDIRFTAHPSQTTAIIGSTGSGKSSIVNLIPRFYDVTEGSILIDGIDIREVTQHDLREQIGYIPQKGNLFSGTIESNLRYADENASESELREAADISQASEFIFTNPEGMKAEVSQGGGNVSGGQKQRLSIARALVKQPPIYILDDSFSALDFRTDAALRKALKEKTGSSTLLIVTQRISTIRNADQIVVLEEGHVVGIGNHRELMEQCETYREIALSQLSKEELE
jgi:ATP-binding cassette, subfamily B, multidrug efflux pump